MSDKKLLPCPFCGSDVDMEVDPIGKGKFLDSVSCKNIECVTMRGYRTSKEKAVEDWNTRKSIEKIVDRLEELHDAPKVESAYNNGWQESAECSINIVKEEGGLYE